MAVRDHLQAIYDSEAYLTDELVVKNASPKTHPLHAHFEWDDSVAGHKYRLSQAADLIRSVEIVYREDDEDRKSVRFYHSVPVTDGGRVYRSIDDITADPVLREIVLRQMDRDWQSFKRRYGHFDEFTGLVNSA